MKQDLHSVALNTVHNDNDAQKSRASHGFRYSDVDLVKAFELPLWPGKLDWKLILSQLEPDSSDRSSALNTCTE